MRIPTTVAACVAFTCLACGLANAATVGKVKKHIYYSPAQNFHVPVPDGLGMKINDAFRKERGAGFVSFHDDFGQNDGIAYYRIPTEILLTSKTDDSRRELLQDFLENVVMKNWQSEFSPNCRLIHHTAGTFEEMPAVFALAFLPGGSNTTVINQGIARRLDSRRGLILFVKGTWLYMLATETGFLANQSSAEQDDKWMLFVGREKERYHSITFTP